MRVWGRSPTTRRFLQFFPKVIPTSKGGGTDPSVHTTTSDAGSRRKNSAAASSRPGSELEKPSINVVTVKFWGAQGK